MRRKNQPALKSSGLVFLDETGAGANMTRRYGRAPKGQRCAGSAPHGRWKTTAFVAGLRCHDITAPMALDGAMNGQAFLAWVKTFLRPTLKPGDLVVADHLSSHKVAGVKEAMEAAGASLRFLPPYSPDLNPMEKMFAKLKALLRKAGKRAREALWKQIGRSLDKFTPQECRNYFASSGYVNI